MNITGTIIAVLVLLLSGASYFAYHQTESLIKSEAQVDSLKFIVQEKDKQILENNSKITGLNEQYKESEEKAALVQEKALKDISRVEEIAKRKGKLYERLVNRDFKKTQNELREVTR